MSTLDSFLGTWKEKAKETVSVLARDPDRPEELCPVQAPKYLFRGEKALYPATFSSRTRFQARSATTPAQACVLSHVDELLELLLALGLDRLHSEALLQHYELPSDHFDVTTSPEVAAAFAFHDRSAEDGTHARIYVFETAELWKQARVLDLSGISFARRPRHQLGYSISFPDSGRDLQTLRRADTLEFMPDREDPEEYRTLIQQMYGPANKDPVASLLNQLVTVELGLSDKPLHESCAAWFEQKVPWTLLALTCDGRVDWEKSYGVIEDAEALP